VIVDVFQPHSETMAMPEIDVQATPQVQIGFDSAPCCTEADQSRARARFDLLKRCPWRQGCRSGDDKCVHAIVAGHFSRRLGCWGMASRSGGRGVGTGEDWSRRDPRFQVHRGVWRGG